MMEFKIKDGERVRTVKALKASATVLPAGCLVTLDGSGLAIKAISSSTALAYCPNGGVSGVTEVDVTLGKDFTLIGLGNAASVFAAAQKGTTCDIQGTTSVTINNGATSQNVIRIGISKDAGVIGSAANIEFRIEKQLF
jgi:hypothetical protein